MLNRPGTGPAVTWAMTFVGGPSVPGAHGFPDGSIADLDDRWRLIEEDTLLGDQELIENDPELAAQIIGSPVDERVEDYRLIRRLDEILAQLADWSAEFDQ